LVTVSTNGEHQPAALPSAVTADAAAANRDVLASETDTSLSGPLKQ
jgi:hypothetical protein